MRFKQFSSNLEHPFRKTKGKNMRFSFISMILKLFLSLQLVIMSPNLVAQTKLGYVKVDEVIRKANIAKQAEERLKKEFAPRDNELKKMGVKLKNLAGKFDKEQSVMTNSDKQKVQREISNLEKEIQRKQRQAREDLTQRKNEELAAVVEKARAVIKKIAVEEKFDLILENSVYASPNIDITQKVIKVLNDQK